MKDNKKKATKKARVENQDAPDFKIIKTYKSGAKVIQYDGDNSKPLIRIPTSNDGRFFMQFGITKAKAMVNNIQSLDKFVKEYDKK